MVDPSAFAPFNFAQSYGQGLQLRQMQQEQQNKRRLADLLPQAVNGDKAAIAQIAEVDPRLFMQLDDRQRQQAQSELADVSSAVRWSMSDPAQKTQRWNQVVDFYSQHHPDLAEYRDHPELAETALLRLGQIGEYLKPQTNGQPSSVQEYEYAKGQGFGGSYVDFRNQMGSPLVVDNGDGTKTIYPHGVGAGQQQQPSMQGGPQPGAVVGGYRFKGGNPNDQSSWEPVNGGQSPAGSGGFL